MRASTVLPCASAVLRSLSSRLRDCSSCLACLLYSSALRNNLLGTCVESCESIVISDKMVDGVVGTGLAGGEDERGNNPEGRFCESEPGT